MKRSHELLYCSLSPPEGVVPRYQRNIGEEVEEVILKFCLLELHFTVRCELRGEERDYRILTPFTTLTRTCLDHKPEEIWS